MAQKPFSLDGGLVVDDTVTFNGDLNISGNLAVAGSQIINNVSNLNVENHEIILNSIVVSGQPVLDASIVASRGDEPNTSIRWNELTDQWELTNDGVSFSKISTTDYSDILALNAVAGAGYATETYVNNTLAGKAEQSFLLNNYTKNIDLDVLLNAKADKTALADVQAVQATKANKNGDPNEDWYANEIWATGEITAHFSDQRLKDNLGNITDAVTKVKALNGFYYTNNILAQSLGFSNDKTYVGVSAQEVQAVLPEIVSPAPFDTEIEAGGEKYSRTGENYITVSYEKLVPLLIEAIKEQDEKITRLEALVAQLTSN